VFSADIKKASDAFALHRLRSLFPLLSPTNKITRKQSWTSQKKPITSNSWLNKVREAQSDESLFYLQTFC